MQHTALHQAHIDAGAKMVDFAGWHMPINYGSQIEEHHQVRQDAGMFDVSHMVVIDLKGSGCRNFLHYLLANNIDKLQKPGKALYSCMLNPEGGVIDDLITYYLNENWFRLVVNAGTRDKDIAWMEAHLADFELNMTVRDDLSMIAVQGPNAREKAMSILGAEERAIAESLTPFVAAQAGDYFIARTGYTGEDGFEIMLPNEQAEGLFTHLQTAGVKPIGLGARDTLRLEAGMNLYGQDMDESVSPLVSGLTWTVSFDEGRDFIGRGALEAEKAAGVKQRFVGLLLEDRGVLRSHQTIVTEEGEGETTSGSFSPTLERSIAFARIPVGEATSCEVLVRKKRLKARIVKAPFARNGKVCIDL